MRWLAPQVQPTGPHKNKNKKQNKQKNKNKIKTKEKKVKNIPNCPGAILFSSLLFFLTKKG